MREARWPLRAWLLATLILTSALAAPELSPDGLSLTAAVAAALGLQLVLTQDEKAVGVPSSRTLALILAAYLVMVLLHSSQPHRSFAFLAGMVPAGLAFLAARRESREGSGDGPIVIPLIAAGGFVSIWGLHQVWFGLGRMARELRALGRIDLDPEILRAESGRAFAGFLLPSALGIYLVMTLPLTAGFLFRREPTHRFLRVLAGLLFVLQVLGIAASRSYGAVAALVLAGFCLLPSGRGTGRARVAAAFLAAAGGAFIYSQRGLEGLTPLTLRIGNWIGAVRIFLGSPLLGVGFANFPDAYARQMTTGMNETAYAHNSYLQAAAEGGVLALLWTVGGAIALFSRLRLLAREDPDPRRSFLIALAPAAFLVHNLFDFSACLPSLLIPFAAILGLALPRRGGPGPGRWAAPPAGTRVRRVGVLLILLGWTAWEAREARTGRLLLEGRARLAEGNLHAARTPLLDAARSDPSHPDPPAFLAEIILSELPAHPEARKEGEGWALRAVRLRPEKALGHYVASQYRYAAGDPGGAYLEISQARLLFPAKELYRKEQDRLREFLDSAPGFGSR